ncbi:MAG TPA: amino acid adenylation domain-containing protein, partial [Symbiobacteriaceae bacterium]|nr:amino acid adenylation domain-containing protein [Symbiobacteriaceae bacterium]
GFLLTEAPLTRITLFRLTDESYQVVWSIHHMLMDGWCVPQIMNEVFETYGALKLGQAPALEPVRPYGDYIAWLGQRDLTEAEAFWRERLRGFAEPTPLGIDRGSVQPGEARGYAEQVRTLPDGLTAVLQKVAQQHQLTLNTVLQGAWALLLSRYSGEEDVVFGATVSGRSADLPGVERIIGPLINTLPVRVSVVPSDTLASTFQRLQSSQAEARQFEYSPLLQVQGWSEVGRGVPLFESLLVFENAAIYAPSAGEDQGPDLELTSYADHTNYPITIVVLPGRELSLKVSYDRDRLDDGAIERMLGHMVRLLQSMAAYPEQRVGELSLLTDRERQQLAQWNNTAADYPLYRSVQALVEAQAAAAPNAVAMEASGRQLTYGELNRQANRLARQLRTLGVGPGALVGILAEPSPAMVVGQLAVLKAGGAYVPMDPAYPQGRIAFMLEDAGVTVLLTRQHLQDRLPMHGIRVIDLDAPLAGDDANLTGGAALTDPAYVIYTSGSTGKPKGAVVSHASLLNLVFWHRETYAVTAADRATQIAGPAFDASVWELWPYLTAGATLCVPDAATRLSPDQLATWLVDSAITLSFVPTPLAEEMLTRAWPANTALRAMFTGGDQLHHFPTEQTPFALINHYGPTEATVVATAGTVAPRAGRDRAPAIGRPIANTQVFLLDNQLRQVPIGVPGEIHIAGAGLALGYWRRPDLTDRKFVPNPFSTDPQARLYKTGDLARWLPDGSLEFVGRSDNQVKIRGFRVELGEIEAVLLQHPAVHDAVVLARQDLPGEKRLAAYVVPAGDEPTATDLRSFLTERLPAYMVPAHYVCLEHLPLMPNGKVDRRALPMPTGALAGLSRAFVAPRDWLELELVQVWEAVLGVAPISVTDNFFALGGHSLTAVRLVSRMQAVLGPRITVSALFKAPTVAELAAHSRQQGTAPSVLVPIQPDGTQPPLFFVHPVGGGVACYQPLAQALGLEQPLYGLQSPGLSGEACDQIESLAATYLEAMRSVQPAGPYQLGGWSLGGLIAYEMARQLTAAGEAVALIALVDTHLKAPAMTDLVEGESDLFQAMLQGHLKAFTQYEPQPYDGPVALFRATDRGAGALSLGWDELVSQLTVQEIEGDHESLIDSRALAAALQNALRSITKR